MDMTRPIAHAGVAVRVAAVIVVATGISLAVLVWGWTAVTAGPDSGDLEACTGDSITIVGATYATGEDTVSVDVASTGTEHPETVTVILERDGAETHNTTITRNDTTATGIYTARFERVRYPPGAVTAMVDGCPSIRDHRTQVELR